MATAVAIITRGPIEPAHVGPPCPPLSPAQAAEVSVAMIGDVLDNTRGRDRAQFIAYVGHAEPLGGLFDDQVRMLPQYGPTCTERTARIQRELFRLSYDRVVMIGAESPTVEPELVARAVRRLDEADVVLGPARDHGYTLIAARIPTPVLFTDVRTSTPRMLTDSVAKAREADLRVRLTAPRQPLRSVNDYENAVVRGELQHAPRTVAAMERCLADRDRP
jgi:uncharacterized protein